MITVRAGVAQPAMSLCSWIGCRADQATTVPNSAYICAVTASTDIFMIILIISYMYAGDVQDSWKLKQGLGQTQCQLQFPVHQT